MSLKFHLCCLYSIKTCVIGLDRRKENAIWAGYFNHAQMYVRRLLQCVDPPTVGCPESFNKFLI